MEQTCPAGLYWNQVTRIGTFCEYFSNGDEVYLLLIMSIRGVTNISRENF